MTEKHNSRKTRLKTAFFVLRNKTDPLGDKVIMPMDGSSYGDVKSMHTSFITERKKSQRKNPNKRCVYMMSLLHCTSEGGTRQQPRPPQ